VFIDTISARVFPIALIIEGGRKTERIIESCEHCNAEGVEMPFDNILDRVIGSDPSAKDYIIDTPVKCVRRGAEINEKTFVGPA